MNRAISDSFALQFRKNVSPSQATKLWLPVVRSTVPFSNSLQVEELRGSLRNSTRVNEAMENFRATLRSVSTNVDLFGGFSKEVEEFTQRASMSPAP